LGANSISNVNWSNASNNWSYYGQTSTNLVATVNQYVAPLDVQTALYVVWVNDADFVNDMSGGVYPSTNIVLWTAANNQSLTNHYNIVTNLYAKGVRTLLMPNAVDVTEIPAYDNLQVNSPDVRNFIRQQVISFNAGFVTMLNRAKTNCPGLTIYVPDFFTLLDQVLTNSAAYGLTNALYGGVSEDAYDDPALYGTLAINGPGTNYIFWDKTDPTAKVHEIMADTAQQLMSPVQISKLTVLTGSNRLDVANIPIGLNGIVLGSTNLALTNWTSVTNFSSTNTAQSVFVPGSGPLQFYRLNFPFTWTWP
jgi:phospholipase/lecithinase/hemolysin